ncbi:MAG: hypothetical protein E4H14_01755 [Candidatus Thorarchaeota archaeon]|nr:MAG: hypothetical protein E4H14_01755 [Candidatus Thorarchaeota archaeon]
MTSGPTWKLVNDDSSIDEFIDIRRIVGNQVIRAYLLNGIIETRRVEKIPGKLRGPKNEFKDFAKFLIIRIKKGDSEFKILAETGVYENLRIVGTDSEELVKKTRDEVIKIFTDALENPEENDTKLILSNDSEVK